MGRTPKQPSSVYTRLNYGILSGIQAETILIYPLRFMHYELRRLSCRLAHHPLATSADGRYNEYQSEEQYDEETMEFAGISPRGRGRIFETALGGGVDEKHKAVEGIGWKASIEPTSDGVAVTFKAHDELLDDLIPAF